MIQIRAQELFQRERYDLRFQIVDGCLLTTVPRVTQQTKDAEQVACEPRSARAVPFGACVPRHENPDDQSGSVGGNDDNNDRVDCIRNAPRRMVSC